MSIAEVGVSRRAPTQEELIPKKQLRAPISGAIEAVYAGQARPITSSWHFTRVLKGQERAIGVGLLDATQRVSDELQSHTVNGRPPRIDHLSRLDLFRMRKAVATIALGAGMFKEFLPSPEVIAPPQKAFQHLQSAINAHTSREFSNAYMDATHELATATALKETPLILEDEVFSEMVGEALAPHLAHIENNGNYTPPRHKGAVLLPFAVIAASAALPNNSRLGAAAGTAITMADISASLHNDLRNS